MANSTQNLYQELKEISKTMEDETVGLIIAIVLIILFWLTIYLGRRIINSKRIKKQT